MQGLIRDGIGPLEVRTYAKIISISEILEKQQYMKDSPERKGSTFLRTSIPSIFPSYMKNVVFDFESVVTSAPYGVRVIAM